MENHKDPTELDKCGPPQFMKPSGNSDYKGSLNIAQPPRPLPNVSNIFYTICFSIQKQFSTLDFLLIFLQTIECLTLILSLSHTYTYKYFVEIIYCLFHLDVYNFIKTFLKDLLKRTFCFDLESFIFEAEHNFIY